MMEATLLMWILMLVSLWSADAGQLGSFQSSCVLQHSWRKVAIFKSSHQACTGYDRSSFIGRRTAHVEKEKSEVKIQWTSSRGRDLKEVIAASVKDADDRDHVYCIHVPNTWNRRSKKRLICQFDVDVNSVTVDVRIVRTRTIWRKSKRRISLGGRQRCYDWKPRTLSMIPHPLNNSITVSWDPPFRVSGLLVELVNKDNKRLSKSRYFRSYETRDNPTHNFSFRNVTTGTYTAKIRPSGCRDCPDNEKNVCTPVPIETDAVMFVASKDQTVTFQKQLVTPLAGGRQTCYDWKPRALFMTPHPLNSSITVSWDPPFRVRGLRVELVNKDDDRLSKSKEWRPYETRDCAIRNVTFRNVTTGVYTATIRSFGCRDCSDAEENGCFSHTWESDAVRFWKGADETGSNPPLPRYTVTTGKALTSFNILIGLAAFVVTLVVSVATGIFFYKVCKH